jgi:nucleoprotein TPR
LTGQLAEQEAAFHLQSEAAQLTSHLFPVRASREAREANSNAFKNPTQRTELLQRQLDGLGRQVQTLLKELGRCADPSLPVDAEVEEMDSLPAENIDAVITNNLAFFRRAEPESTQDRPRT